MKTIVETSTQLSKYLVSDTSVITPSSENIHIDQDGSVFFICDLNSTNTTVYENITNSPEDWEGNKFTFDGSTWTEVTE